MSLNILISKRVIIIISTLFLPILAHAEGVIPLWFAFLYGAFVLGMGSIVVIGFVYFLKKFVEIRREEIKKERILKKREQRKKEDKEL